MAPGPDPLQPGTWEAPKWPPRAQLRRRCCPGWTEPGTGAGRPAGHSAGHVPRVEPADDVVSAHHRAVGERRPRVADDADLHADAALVVDPGETVAGGGRPRLAGKPRRGHGGHPCPAGPAPSPSSRPPASSPAPCVQPVFSAAVRVLRPSQAPGSSPGLGRSPGLLLRPVRRVGPAERPPGPDHRDELGDITRERIPHQVRGAPEFDEALRRGARRYRHGVGVQHQPDRPRCAALQDAAISGGEESLGPRHPRVSHYDPSEGSRPVADLAPFKYLRQGSSIVQRPVHRTMDGACGRPRARTRDRSEGCGG